MSEGPTNRRWPWTLLAIVATPLAVTFMLAPAFQQASNCGGNSAALSACRGFVVILEQWDFDNPGRAFRYDMASPDLNRELKNLPGASWVQPARFLAKRNDARYDPPGPKRIVVVCDRAYNNVPRHALWKAPMAHAVGYSTGATGLISPTEFAQLDLDGFIDLRQVVSNSDSE